MGDGVFENVDKNICELRVPKGHKAEYEAAEQWKEFAKIIEHDLTGISLPVSQDNDGETTIFSIDGQRLPKNVQPSHGIYIINGKKVSVK